MAFYLPNLAIFTLQDFPVYSISTATKCLATYKIVTWLHDIIIYIILVTPSHHHRWVAVDVMVPSGGGVAVVVVGMG